MVAWYGVWQSDARVAALALHNCVFLAQLNINSSLPASVPSRMHLWSCIVELDLAYEDEIGVAYLVGCVTQLHIAFTHLGVLWRVCNNYVICVQKGGFFFLKM